MWESDCEVASWLLSDYLPQGYGLSAGRQEVKLGRKCLYLGCTAKRSMTRWKKKELSPVKKYKLGIWRCIGTNSTSCYSGADDVRGSYVVLCSLMRSYIKIFFLRVCVRLSWFDRAQGLCTPHTTGITSFIPVPSLCLNHSSDFGSKITAVRDDLRKFQSQTPRPVTLDGTFPKSCFFIAQINLAKSP